MLVARREHRLWGISDNARLLGAKHALVMAADVVKEEECRRFIYDTINYFGHCKCHITFLSWNFMIFRQELDLFQASVSSSSMIVSKIFFLCNKKSLLQFVDMF